MKKFLSLIAVMALLFTGCQRDNIETVNANSGDEVMVTLGIDAPEMDSTRTGESGMNSALGAIDNFDNAQLWDMFDVRYMLEIYDVTRGYENTATPIKERMVNIHDAYQSTMFQLRLIPGRTYKFVVWADFVADGSHTATDKLAVEGLHYNTTDLHNITLNEWTPMDECRDAYFIQQDIAIESSLNTSLTLTRPFGKIRVVTTDIEELNIGSVPGKVTITYQNHPIFNSLDAITGNISTELSGDALVHTYNIAKDTPYSEGLDSNTTHQTIFMDYLYAKDEQTEVNFTIDVYEANGRLIRSNSFDTQIPIQRNHLTTIIGNLLTTATNIEIRIDDNFADEHVINVWDGEFEALPEKDANGNITITTAGQLATLLAGDPDGMTVLLGADIDFGGAEVPAYRNTAKGNNAAFKFDGQNHTIANFTASEGVSAGLFSDLVNATISNLNINGAVVAPGASTRAATDFYAGALVGRTYGTCRFNNINIIDCEVEGNNKVGGLIGSVAEGKVTVNGVVVDGSTIYTQNSEDGGCVGGLVGYITSNGSLFENNTVKNTTITAINSINEAKRANAEFIGVFQGGNNSILTLNNNTLEGNTFTEATTTYETPEAFGAWLGGVRYEDGADVIIDGESVMASKPEKLASPSLECQVVKGRIFDLSWEPIENATQYTITVTGEMFHDTHTVTDCTSQVGVPEYGTTYTITIVANPSDDRYIDSDPTSVEATTATPLDNPIVTAAVAKDGKSVTLSWNEVDNAAYYTVSVNDVDVIDVGSGTTYSFVGEYNSEYVCVVTAYPAEEDADKYVESIFTGDNGRYIVQLGSDPHIYLKPNSNWVKDNARFAVYTWGNGIKWVDMTDNDSDGIYEVYAEDLQSNIIFCRMNAGTTDNNWDNKWNQTVDLTKPEDGTNLFTIADGAWDNANGTWSTK